MVELEKDGWEINMFNTDDIVIAKDDIGLFHYAMVIPEGTKGLVLEGGENPLVLWINYRVSERCEGKYLESKNLLEEFINWIYSDKHFRLSLRLSQSDYGYGNLWSSGYDTLNKKEAIRLIDKFYLR
jgi:hypothetical protein